MSNNNEFDTLAITSDFVEAWRIDYSEQDGERTYAVHALRTALLREGHPVSWISACSTQACAMVHMAFTGGAR